MKTYKANFTGRLKGAIGVFYPISTYTKGEDEAAARLFLYERFEHISCAILDESETTLYQACVDAGIATDSHESDLYIPDTAETRWLCKAFGRDGALLSAFTSNIDGKRWLDLPFCYAPFWEAVENRSKARNATTG